MLIIMHVNIKYKMLLYYIEQCYVGKYYVCRTCLHFWLPWKHCPIIQHSISAILDFSCHYIFASSVHCSQN